MKSNVRGLDGLVGDPNAQSYYDQVVDFDFDGAPDITANDEFRFFNYFDAVKASQIPDIDDQYGLRISTGFRTADGGGFMIDGTWNRVKDAQYNARRPIEATRFAPELRRVFPFTADGRFADNLRPFRELRNERDVLELILDPDFNTDFDTDGDGVGDIGPLVVADVLEANLFNLNGLPIDNGTFGGFTQPYDLDYIIKHSHESFGGSFGYLMSPVVEGGFLTVRPMVGARYLRINEGFQFIGIDSNASYSSNADINLKVHSLPNQIDDDDDFIIDNAITSEDNGTGVFVQNGAIIRSFLNNEVSTNLAGPELALRYDVGDSEKMVLYGAVSYTHLTLPTKRIV